MPGNSKSVYTATLEQVILNAYAMGIHSWRDEKHLRRLVDNWPQNQEEDNARAENKRV